MQQQYHQGQAVWINVAPEGQQPEWRQAIVEQTEADGRYKVYKLNELTGPEWTIAGLSDLRPRGEDEQAPAEA